jgi:hypothetical protein
LTSYLVVFFSIKLNICAEVLHELDPILEVGEEMLTERRADAHEDDSVGVELSV